MTARRTYATGNTWPEGSKKYAISAPAAATALRYGKNVSRGILAMQEENKAIHAQCHKEQRRFTAVFKFLSVHHNTAYKDLMKLKSEDYENIYADQEYCERDPK